MTRDDIIRMAREASILGSFDMLQGNQWRQDTIRELERFARSVEANVRGEFTRRLNTTADLAAAAERKKCADLCKYVYTEVLDDREGIAKLCEEYILGRNSA